LRLTGLVRATLPAILGIGIGAGIGAAAFRAADEAAPPAELVTAAAPREERWDRLYVTFVHQTLKPIAERDGLRHTAGGCDVSDTDVLCVECYSPGGEAWVHCTDDGCALVSTNDELNAVGADFGACERWQNRNGLAVSFTRRPH
jgi:hypothetical protein